MSASESPVRHYAVVQDKEWVENEITASIKAGRNIELDLYNEDDMLHVEFRVSETAHDDAGSLIMGKIDKDRTINLHIVKNGEVYALLPN